MRRAWITGLGAALMTACGYGYEARTTTITGAPMITTGPGAGEPELPRTFRAASERLADGICAHERSCGRGGSVSSCVDATAKMASSELKRWNCQPALARARLEECLVGLDAQFCAVSPGVNAAVCPPVEGCGEDQAKLIDPGPALAEIWK